MRFKGWIDCFYFMTQNPKLDRLATAQSGGNNNIRGLSGCFILGGKTSEAFGHRLGLCLDLQPNLQGAQPAGQHATNTARTNFSESTTFKACFLRPRDMYYFVRLLMRDGSGRSEFLF